MSLLHIPMYLSVNEQQKAEKKFIEKSQDQKKYENC